MKRSELIKTAAATTACAALGGVGTDPESLYYRSLRKPHWQPPKLAFPLVWTSLYADIAITTGEALSELDEQGRRDEYVTLLRALAVNLILNTGWSWIFFTFHRRRLAVIECAFLTVSSADLVRRVGTVNRRAGLALIPYPLWCGFATVLSAAIARLNPAR